MKTSIAFAALLFGAMFVANVANAQSHSIVETEAFTARLTQLPGSNKVRVWIFKPIGTKFWITVKDAANYAVGNMAMSAKETQHLYLIDMKDMPNGKYSLEFESNQKGPDGKRLIVSKAFQKESAVLAQPIVGDRFVFSN